MHDPVTLESETEDALWLPAEWLDIDQEVVSRDDLALSVLTGFG